MYASTAHGPEQDSNEGRVWRRSSETEPESDDGGDGRRREDDELGVRLVRGEKGRVQSQILGIPTVDIIIFNFVFSFPFMDR